MKMQLLVSFELHSLCLKMKIARTLYDTQVRVKIIPLLYANTDSKLGI